MARHLSPQMLTLVAERFKVLGEPARLTILNELKRRELSVSDLVERTGMSQANVSKHVNILLRHGFVDRRRDGAFVRYSVTDPDIQALCDMMCKRIEAVSSARVRLVSAR